MNNIGDFFRSAACMADELFIEVTGRLLYYCEKNYKPIMLRGFYEIPDQSTVTVFGIDGGDEMEVELGFHTTVRELKKMPALGDIFMDSFQGKWMLIAMARRDDIIRGQNRLVLTMNRFQESVSSSTETKEESGK